MNNQVHPILACRNLRKCYRDGSRELVILDDISLEIPEGEIVAISGPSGVGKSTLLHIMGTLDQPTSGQVYFKGDTLADMSQAKINRLRNQHIGFVFQFYHLLPEFTALENVMMPALSQGMHRRKCQEPAAHLLEQVGLSDRMTHKPGQLSGGEQQRVAIARALFNKPELLLCDEPTGNLDESTGEGIIELLWTLNQSSHVSFVVVTHDETVAQRAGRWIALHDGKAFTRNG
ncbi:MAG TPA: ABC transporter ATP-binding protein [Candidatus Hydrogenedentes bacterium]|jgi:lipoprotein-releasing system ATP-binding protein|nr:MAG: Lipoprotein-releasing system ATP-binding protein LolD [Candidatus Hydrogenedentes bacterium ADurb.Bin170]HOD94112.1 ABC transporter ATP-binding protein [Candidatus Hydrogenedentota bacterium]HOR49520.1 ABC transporter ATP-binding protein [Candidatus Hydrogenedentota bacterium]HPK23492.1 ABC transporter ATP-binding protein [Candidatus Hydrogenedentota bacterium]HPX85054.1 ABC transporter ATP-binding protein [Candidatus Hydrogenedentota bacterium]